MLRHAVLFSLCLIAIAWGLALPAAAIPVYGTSAAGELTGSRDVGVGGGLKGYNTYDNGVFKIEWEITIGVGSVHYKYTFTGLTSKDISHVVFDYSDNCDVDPLCVTNATINGSAATLDFGNFSGITGAVKLEGIDGMEGAMYEFDSNRLPVYGHLAVKDGGGPETCAAPGGSNIACSNQLVGFGSPDDINDFIARPNGVVPEPGTLPLVGLSIGLLAAARRGRKR